MLNLARDESLPLLWQVKSVVAQTGHTGVYRKVLAPL